MRITFIGLLASGCVSGASGAARPCDNWAGTGFVEQSPRSTCTFSTTGIDYSSPTGGDRSPTRLNFNCGNQQMPNCSIGGGPVVAVDVDTWQTRAGVWTGDPQFSGVPIRIGDDYDPTKFPVQWPESCLWIRCDLVVPE